MDSDVSLIVFAQTFPGFSKSNIHVKLHEDYNRSRLPALDESNIDKIWEARRAKNQKLYNGSKFRFHSLEVSDSNEGLTLHLGLTGYKDFIGTNCAANARQLLELGEANFSNSQAYMSDALGVGAFVQTSDDHVVFIRRSHHVGEAQGLWDVPGGHPEPEEVQGGSAQMEDITLSNISALAVRDELIESTIREIRDEINIPESELAEPYLMGLAKNHTTSGRPSAEFFVKCSLHSTEVAERYKAGGTEADESMALKLVPLSDISTLRGSDMWSYMAPSGQGCILLYTSMMNSSAERL